MADREYKRFAGQSVLNAGYHNFNWDLFHNGNELRDVSFLTLAAAIAVIGSDNKTLYITKKHVISKSTTIPSNISIVTLKGGSFDRASGKVLTISGPYSGFLGQHFTGAGTTVFGVGSVEVARPEWFGMSASSLDNSAAINATLVAAAGVAPVIIGDGTYTADAVDLVENSQFSIYGTLLKKPATTGGLLRFTGSGMGVNANIDLDILGWLDGNAANQNSIGSDYFAYLTAPNDKNLYRGLLDIRACSGVRVRRANIKNNYFPNSIDPHEVGNAFLAYQVSKCEFKNIYLENWGREGFNLKASFDNVIDNVRGVRDANGVIGTPLAVAGGDSYSAYHDSGGARNLSTRIYGYQCGASTCSIDSDDSKVDNVLSVNNAYQSGFDIGHPGESANNVQASNIKVINAGTQGVVGDNYSGCQIQNSTGVQLTDFTSTGAKTDGLRISAGATDVTLKGVYCKGSGSFGLFTFDAGEVTLSGGDLTGNTGGATNITGTTNFQAQNVIGVDPVSSKDATGDFTDLHWNKNNASITAHATKIIRGGGTSGGDPRLRFEVGVAGPAATLGMDASVSGSPGVIAYDTFLGGSKDLVSFTDKAWNMRGRFGYRVAANITSANDITAGSLGNIFPIIGTVQLNRMAIADWQGGSIFWFRPTNAAPGLITHQGGANDATYGRFNFQNSRDYQPSQFEMVPFYFDGTEFFCLHSKASLNAHRVLWTKTASTTVANTTTETTLLDTGVGSKTLAAAFFTVGKTLFFEVIGYYSNLLTPTVQFKFKLGSTVVLDSGAVVTAGTVSNQEFRFRGQMTCRTTGATGTIMAQGEVIIAGLATPLSPVTNTATTTIDTTGTLAADITLTWGTANAANTLTSSNGQIEAEG